LDILNIFKDIALIIAPVVSVLLLVKYVRELRKLTLEQQKLGLEYEKLKKESETQKQTIVNATAEDIAKFVVNPIVKEIEKAERERMELELKHRIMYEKEKYTQALEAQSSRADWELLDKTKNLIQEQRYDVNKIFKSIEIISHKQHQEIREFFMRLDHNINNHLEMALKLMDKYIEHRKKQEDEFIEIVATTVKSANKANAADAKCRGAPRSIK
jgi:biopolymer transport protein ExbB/TolQ